MRRSTGALRRVWSLAAATLLILTTATVVTATPAAAARTKNLVLNGQHGNLGIIQPNGDLYLAYRTDWNIDYVGGSTWIGPTKRGTVWDRFTHVAMAGMYGTYDNLVIGVDQHGSDTGIYVYYWHQNTESWDGPRKVASVNEPGWSGITKLISAGSGTDWLYVPSAAYFYTVDSNGNLWWHRWDGGYGGGWHTPLAVDIGDGWNAMAFVTGTYDGTLWGVRTDGQLLWYRRNLNYHPVNGYWSNQGVGKVIGGGGWYGGPCGFQTVMSGGWGVLYAVDGAGRLRHFTHHGFRDGSNIWGNDPSCGTVIGTEWM